MDQLSQMIKPLRDTLSAQSGLAIAGIIAVIFVVAIWIIYKFNLIPEMNKVIQNAQSSMGGSSTASAESIGGSGDAAADGSSDQAIVYLFKVDWCPHCKTAKPIFEQVKNDYDGKSMNGRTVHFVIVDCEKEPDTADKYKVEGYPTIKMVSGGKVYEYDAKPDYDHIVQFIETSF